MSGLITTRPHIMSELKDFLEAYSLLGKHGDYDTSIAGAIGEAYAEEVLGMEKVNAGSIRWTNPIKNPPTVCPWRADARYCLSATSPFREYHLARTAGWQGASALS